jgi:hypothetical protein
MKGESGRDYPYDTNTGKRIGPLKQPGYYPGFNLLMQKNFWDAATRELILERVDRVPPIRFFTSAQAGLLKIICDHVIPQDDRELASRIPIVPHIDNRLFENRHDGYRFAGMPPDGEAFRLGLSAIEQIAHHLYHREYARLSYLEQDEILKSLHDGKPAAAFEVWDRMPVHRFWSMLVQDCVEVYYAHPWALDEIGFGGPAYPRAYIRLENGLPEPWEQDERRYQWQAPANSLSDHYEPIPASIENAAPHPRRSLA